MTITPGGKILQFQEVLSCNVRFLIVTYTLRSLNIVITCTLEAFRFILIHYVVEKSKNHAFVIVYQRYNIFTFLLYIFYISIGGVGGVISTYSRS